MKQPASEEAGQGGCGSSGSASPLERYVNSASTDETSATAIFLDIKHDLKDCKQG